MSSQHCPDDNFDPDSSDAGWVDNLYFARDLLIDPEALTHRGPTLTVRPDYVEHIDRFDGFALGDTVQATVAAVDGTPDTIYGEIRGFVPVPYSDQTVSISAHIRLIPKADIQADLKAHPQRDLYIPLNELKAVS